MKPERDKNKFTISEISEAIKKTGYVFEQRVAATIEELGFSVITNSAYLDVVEGKSREIDIIAHRSMFKIEELNTTGICYLNCDCKDSSNPLVFFTRKKNWGDKYFGPREVQLVHPMYYKNGVNEAPSKLDAFYFLQLDTEFYYTKSEKRAVQFCKIIRNQSKVEAQSSGVMDSFIYPLVKSYLYHSGNAPKNDTVDKYCKVFYNLIVTNSPLYTVDTEVDDAVPEEVQFVPFTRHIHSTDINGTFLTMFITHDYLPTFIETEVFPFFEAIYKKYTENKHLVTDYNI